MKFLLLSGSFHSKSRSLAILEAVAKLLSKHDCYIPSLLNLPFYSEDCAGDSKPPEVEQLLEEVSQADGLIFCTPEYNHSVPAVLKNAIDWASRPAFDSPLKDKPVTIITQANSPVGGARAQAHLKLIMDSTLSLIHPVHEMMITSVGDKVNASHCFSNDKDLQRLDRHLQDFVVFVGACQERQAIALNR